MCYGSESNQTTQIKSNFLSIGIIDFKNMEIKDNGNE